MHTNARYLVGVRGNTLFIGWMDGWVDGRDFYRCCVRDRGSERGARL